MSLRSSLFVLPGSCAARRHPRALALLLAVVATSTLPAAGADAGFRSPPSAPYPRGLERATPPSPRSRFFPKLIDNPAVLSERVRAQLVERVAAGAGGAPPPLLPRDDAVKRTDPVPAVPEAVRQRRMMAFETIEGVTVLSNRAGDPSPAPVPVAPDEEPSPPVPVPRSPDDEEAPARAAERAPRRRASPASPETARDDAPTRWPWLVLIGTGAAAFGAWFAMRRRGDESDGADR